MYQEGNEGHNCDDRYNLYATFKGNGGKSIMFNGHIDTMPSGDEKLWEYPPHKPTIKDGKVYGLGACDMKGGLMAATMAVKLLQDSNIKLPGDVIITSVVDEEGGGNGSIVAAMNGHADAVVVCEPSEERLITANMGFVFFKVDIGGKANHSGAKWLGASAIEKSIKLINALTELEHKWLMLYKHPLLPSPSLNVGTIEGEMAGSTVAGNCTFQACVHYLPETMSYDSTVEEFISTINRVSKCDEWLENHMPNITIYQAGKAFEMDLDHPIVSVFKNCYKDLFGENIDIVGNQQVMIAEYGKICPQVLRGIFFPLKI